MGSNFVISIKMTPDQDIARMIFARRKSFFILQYTKGFG
jgi:hypothetical protein